MYYRIFTPLKIIFTLLIFIWNLNFKTGGSDWVNCSIVLDSCFKTLRGFDCDQLEGPVDDIINSLLRYYIFKNFRVLQSRLKVSG